MTTLWRDDNAIYQQLWTLYRGFLEQELPRDVVRLFLYQIFVLRLNLVVNKLDDRGTWRVSMSADNSLRVIDSPFYYSAQYAIYILVDNMKINQYFMIDLVRKNEYTPKKYLVQKEKLAREWREAHVHLFLVILAWADGCLFDSRLMMILFKEAIVSTFKFYGKVFEEIIMDGKIIYGNLSRFFSWVCVLLGFPSSFPSLDYVFDEPLNAFCDQMIILYNYFHCLYKQYNGTSVWLTLLLLINLYQYIKMRR